MKNFSEINLLFENYLQEQSFKDTPENLYNPCRHILTLGGKRIRPTSLLMANELFGPITNDAFNAATAIELFHNFSLIHDDIMDNAPLRRGKQTIHEKWDMPTAILSGDVMNIYAYTHLCKVPQQYLQKVLQVFNTTAIEVCEGQQMDMDFEKINNVSIDDYIKMITLKTSVLLAASMQIGAILGGATNGAAKLLYEFGKNLGISFQLKDDYLDAFGKTEKTGKQVGGDILSNKKTFLLLKAIEKANANQKTEIENILNNTNTNNKVDDMLQLFATLDIAQETITAKNYYHQLANDSLDKLPLQENKKVEFRNLANFLLERDY